MCVHLNYIGCWKRESSVSFSGCYPNASVKSYTSWRRWKTHFYGVLEVIPWYCLCSFVYTISLYHDKNKNTTTHWNMLFILQNWTFYYDPQYIKHTYIHIKHTSSALLRNCLKRCEDLIPTRQSVCIKTSVVQNKFNVNFAKK